MSMFDSCLAVWFLVGVGIVLATGYFQYRMHPIALVIGSMLWPLLLVMGGMLALLVFVAATVAILLILALIIVAVMVATVTCVCMLPFLIPYYWNKEKNKKDSVLSESEV